MKIVFTFFVSVFSIFFIYSQCDNGTNYYPTTIYDPAAGSWGSAATNNWAGEVIQVTVVAGDVYEFSTCATFGGVQASYDTQLTLRDEGNLVLVFDDDGCGTVYSYINWTATYSGTAYLHLNLYNCITNSVSTEVRIFRTSAPLTYVPDDAFEHYLETHDAAGATVSVGDPTSMGNGVDYDDYVFTANINTVTDLDLSNSGSGWVIYDLTGIAGFTDLLSLNCGYNWMTSLDVSQNTALDYLDCTNDELTSLDVSQNIALTDLNCGDNELTSLNISNNTALDYLNCAENQFTSLDVSQNTALTSLNCSANQFTSLDVSQNTALTSLSCTWNQLTSLDVSQNTALTLLHCYQNVLTCLNVQNGNNTNLNLDAVYNSLTCIEVDDPTWATANWTAAGGDIDAGVAFSTNCFCGVEMTYVPDDAFEHFLETHAWDGTNVAIGDPTSMGNGVDYDDFVFTASIDTITDLYMLSTISTGIDFPGIFDLTGIEDFTALYHLNVNYNSLTSVDLSNNPDLYGLHVSDQVNGALTSVNVSNNTLLDHVYIARNNLTSLDLSNNIALTELSCNENLIPSLDLSNNTALSQLWCYENQLTSLDLSSHSALTLISCSDNQLSCLNVKNGNNTNLSLWAIGNPLTCIEVDDPTSATADWTVANDNIDVGVTFSTNCNNDCSTVGLQDEAISSISIFPNPFNSEVEITSDVLMNRISVLDMSGKEVFRSAPENKNMKLKLDFLKSGVYTLVVESDEMITTRRIIKK